MSSTSLVVSYDSALVAGVMGGEGKRYMCNQGTHKCIMYCSGLTSGQTQVSVQNSEPYDALGEKVTNSIVPYPQICEARDLKTKKQLAINDYIKSIPPTSRK